MQKIPPFAHWLGALMKTHGTYAHAWPLGCVVHFTAGNDGAANTIRGGVKDGYAYWCIQKDGSLFCAHSAEKWGYHAGKSFFKPLGSGMNSKLIGIEINCSGRLKGKPGAWYQDWKGGKHIPDAETRTVVKSIDNIKAGTYERYTPAQEKTLIETIMWLKENSPAGVFSFDNVVGHDSVAPLRKNDPGASLSMTITEFRALLKREWEKRKDAKAKHTEVRQP